MYYLLSTGLVLYAVATYILLRRNNAVYKYRTQLIDKIFRIKMQRIDSMVMGETGVDDSGFNGVEAYTNAINKAFDSVGYGKMVWTFWRPLPKFYTGTILEAEGLTKENVS